MNAEHAMTLKHYTHEQIEAALTLWNAAKRGLDTSGGRVCSLLLLGLYNGPKYTFDLTDLRLLDNKLHAAAMTVVMMDSRRTWCEIHLLLNAALGLPGNRSTGATMALWAYDMGLPQTQWDREQLADLRGRKA